MIQKYLLPLIAGLLIGTGQNVCAEGQALSGFGLQLAFGAASTSTHDSFTNDPTTIRFFGSASSAAMMGIGYAHTFDGNFDVGGFISHFNLGTFLSADLNRDKAGGYTTLFDSHEVQLRNLKAISLQPGMVLGRTSLAYLKAGYWRGDVLIDLKGLVNIPESHAHSIRAWSVGVGLRSQISRHITLGVEAEQLQFSKVEVDFPLNGEAFTEQPKQLRAVAMLGVTF